MKTIEEIFAGVFGVTLTEINDDMSYIDCEFWDSVTHMRIIARMEEEYDIEFDMDDIIAMETIKKAKEILRTYTE
jgi:acyl carrier protein